MKSNISNLLQLEFNCRKCETFEELRYLIVNQTRKLIPYEQAVFLSFDYKNSLKVEAISDITTVDRNSVYVQTIQTIVNNEYIKNNSLHTIDIINEVEEYEREKLIEYGFDNLLYVPIRISRDDIEQEFVLVLFKNEQWGKKELDLCTHISSSFSYFIYALTKCSFKSKLKKTKLGGYFKYLFILLILAMFIPVKLTVLAPLEVVAKDPFIVTSSLDGVIDEIKVKPNEYIKKDSLIVKLNDIDYSNRYLIAKKSLNIAKAQLYTAQQASFYDVQEKNRIDSLKAQVSLKQSELQFAKEQLDKTLVYSKSDGIAIIHNPNEWKGKPVVTGERIFEIANRNEVELKIMLPVSDAIFLKEKALVKAFLDNDPLNSWSAHITHISYKPELTQDNLLSYKISANFDNVKDGEKTPTIGLRGTAKIYSSEVTLFFYLFKKPITSLRQLIGW